MKLWLEDVLPLLREVYSYDSTYHEIFRKKVLTSGAHVFLRKRKNAYFIVPCGLQEKIEDCYILLTLTLYPESELPTPTRWNWNELQPRSLGIHYLYDRSEWKQTMKNRLQAEEFDFLLTLTRQDFENLYYYEF